MPKKFDAEEVLDVIDQCDSATLRLLWEKGFEFREGFFAVYDKLRQRGINPGAVDPEAPHRVLPTGRRHTRYPCSI